MSEQGKQAAKVAAMIAGGAVIGAGLGILFAPKAGVDTRRDIGRYAKKAQVQATRWGRNVQSGVQDVLNRGKQLVQRPEVRPVIEAA
ncbi:MAG: YtxH domain-containing protein [Nitrospira sp.]